MANKEEKKNVGTTGVIDGPAVQPGVAQTPVTEPVHQQAPAGLFDKKDTVQNSPLVAIITEAFANFAQTNTTNKYGDVCKQGMRTLSNACTVMGSLTNQSDVKVTLDKVLKTIRENTGTEDPMHNAFKLENVYSYLPEVVSDEGEYDNTTRILNLLIMFATRKRAEFDNYVDVDFSTARLVKPAARSLVTAYFK